MSELIIIHAKGIEELAAELHKATADIAQALQTFDSQVALLRAHWTGAASDAYERSNAQWRASIDALNALLADGSTRIATAADAYNTAEETNRARW